MTLRKTWTTPLMKLYSLVKTFFLWIRLKIKSHMIKEIPKIRRTTISSKVEMDLEFSASKCVQTYKSITCCFVRLNKTIRVFMEKNRLPKPTKKKVIREEWKLSMFTFKNKWLNPEVSFQCKMLLSSRKKNIKWNTVPISKQK